jgi:galactitol-specific phosphotransferase system IIC component
MSDDLETLVRKSLDTVDRSRRFAAIATGVVFLLFVLTLGFLMARARVDSPAAAKLLWAATAAQMAFIGLCTALLVGHVTRMTKAVLRAIELGSRRKDN